MYKTLKLKGSLGDHVVYTGIPEAFYKKFGYKLFVDSSYPLLWESNPYISKERLDPIFNIEYEQSESEWNTYKPRRVFMQMTGIDPAIECLEVSPKLYRIKQTEKNLIIVNDEAGWPSRRGFAHWPLLLNELRLRGFKIVLLKTANYRDCVGQYMEEAITIFDEQINNPTLETVINWISRARWYIGYESAYAHIAGALHVDYVLFLGSLPEITSRHPSCKLVLNNCISPCHRELCEKQCLKSLGPEELEKIFKLLIL